MIKKLIHKICLCHAIAEILLKLASLNTNQVHLKKNTKILLQHSIDNNRYELKTRPL
jgi:hypothetical protein